MSDQDEELSIKTLKHTFLSGVKLNYLAGGLCGGVVSTLITHPFDLVKLRLAVHSGTIAEHRPKYSGFYHGIKSVYSESGLSGLYRGASANVTGAGLSWGFYFFLYNAFKFHLQDGVASKPLHPASHLVCASIAGMLTLSVTNPVWVVKTRLCLANTASVPVHKRYSGLIDGLAKLYWHEGLRGLYRGFIPGLWGTSHGAIQFMFYEEFKKAYADYHSIPIDSKLGPFAYVAMAASSKFLAVSLTYPYQVVRARLQDQELKYDGIKDIAVKIIRHEGVTGFYKGVTANLLKVVPATCLTFVVYEYVSSLLKQS